MRDHKGDPAPRKSIERLKDMLFRCRIQVRGRFIKDEDRCVFQKCASDRKPLPLPARETDPAFAEDRKSTRLNSSHVSISYAVFCLKKKSISASSRYEACTPLV